METMVCISLVASESINKCSEPAHLDDAKGGQSTLISCVDVAHKNTCVRPFGLLTCELVTGFCIGNLQSGELGDQIFRGLIDKSKLSDLAKSALVT